MWCERDILDVLEAFRRDIYKQIPIRSTKKHTFLDQCLDHAAHALGEHVVGPVADRTNNRVYYITPTCADSSRRLGRKLTVWKAGRRSA